MQLVGGSKLAKHSWLAMRAEPIPVENDGKAKNSPVVLQPTDFLIDAPRRVVTGRLAKFPFNTV